MDKAFERYTKALGREELRFNKRLQKSKTKTLRPFKKELTSLWAVVEAKMSEAEKDMTHSQWLEYYNKVKSDEFGLLQNSNLNLAYLARYMTAQGFREKRSNDFYVGQKWVEMTVLQGNDTMQIDQMCIVDLDQKVVTNVHVKNNRVLLEPFHDLIIYGLNSKGEYFILRQEAVEQLFNKNVVQLNEASFIQSISNTAAFYKENIYPEIMK